jgi:alpha/beta superfamily hydrolase
VDIAIGSGRDVRATVDRVPDGRDWPAVEPEPTPATGGDGTGQRSALGATDRVVVACPPHPQLGGSRSDSRLRALGTALTERGVACLRFDYGPWDEGRGEVRDARTALAWARERADRVGVAGYSFGGAVAVLAAARSSVDALAVLAPASRLGEDLDAATALAGVQAPTLVVYGERDDTADWRPLVERARERAHAGHPVTVEGVPADHHFVGQRDRVADRLATFLDDRL